MRKVKHRHLAVIGVLFILLAVFAAAHEGEGSNTYDWLGHATLAVAGILLWILVSASGILFKRKVFKVWERNTFTYHKALSVLFTLVMIVTFIYGLQVTASHGEPLMSDNHGWIGLAIVVLALIQTIISLLLKNRQKIRVPHKILGYAIGILLLIQLILGVQSVLT